MTTDAFEFLAEVWQQKPSMVVFLVLGSAVFAGLVVDSYRLHRQRSIRHRTGLY